MLALLMSKTFKTALRARGNKPTAPLARGKCIPPLVAGATTFPPQAVGQQPVLTLEPLMSEMLYGALLSTVHILHRMCKSGEVRRLACP